MIDLRHVAALLATGRVQKEEAIRVGEQLLVEGNESPSVVELARLAPNECDSALDLLGDVLSDLETEIPDAKNGAFRLGLDQIEAIASGATDPIEGARWIWREVWSDHHFPEFSGFVALVDELDEAVDRSDRKAIADEIVVRAKQMSGL